MTISLPASCPATGFPRIPARLRALLLALAAGLAAGCGTPAPGHPPASAPAADARPAPSAAAAPAATAATGLAGFDTELGRNPPPAPREFRAAWVASVANIDWPTKKGLPVAQQQAEAIAILDRARAMHLNAIVLQVRPSADALYASPLEPWSEFLTGAQGRAPEPFYDPLDFWIEQAHKRGLELHAWFNPYRARHTAAKGPLAPNHIANLKPGAVKSYGGFLWIDPADAGAAEHTFNVMLDVVRRYDIDGVHMDDYFYPYPVQADGAPVGAGGAKEEVDFPDEPTWKAYVAAGGRLSRADWRRSQVDRFVERLYDAVHREKRWVRVGISPFGLGRPDRRPPGIAGFSQYDKLYADVELWLSKGWLDYLAPQLYWPIEQAAQSYPVLLDYWMGANPQRRHVWPGLYTSKIDDAKEPFMADQIIRQVEIARQRQAGGHIHFSMAALMQNRQGIADRLRGGQYATAALPPATPWLDARQPQPPTVREERPSGAANGVQDGGHAGDGAAVASGGTGGKTEARPRGITRLVLSPGPGTLPVSYALWSRYGSEWRFSVVPALEPVVELEADPKHGAPSAVVVTAVSRTGIESPRVRVEPGR